MITPKLRRAGFLRAGFSSDMLCLTVWNKQNWGK